MLTYNGFPVVIRVSHVTEPGEGWKGSKYLTTCKSLDELQKFVNSSVNKPEPGWQWEFAFEDDE